MNNYIFHFKNLSNLNFLLTSLLYGVQCLTGVDLVKGKVHQSEVHDRGRVRKVPGWRDHRHGPKHGPVLGPDRGHISRKVKTVIIHRRMMDFCDICSYVLT